MSIKDATTINKASRDGFNDPTKLAAAVQHILDQLAKVEAGEVEGLVVSILNKNGEDNLIGLAGNLPAIKDCTTEVLLRLIQVTTAAAKGGREDGLAVPPEDINNFNFND